MTNKIRGDSEFLAGAEKFVMRLTLGALAEIEDGLGLHNLSDIASRLKQLSSGDLAVVAAALLRGGGHDLATSDVLRLATDIGTLVGAVSDAFGAAGLAKSNAQGGGEAPLAGAASSNSPSA
ncbi:MAG TPA: GTA-gp10 family protein [Rhizomicrobium sp.]|jgi:hypothetical protein|nr:GTA-gp10 family protein [Rhizomicrobium sp.]